MASTEEVAIVREKLGETDMDNSLFTDDQVGRWIDSTSSVTDAIVEGWEAKVAHYAGLVSVTDGAASRAFSDLHTAAVERLNYYMKKSGSTRSSRSRVGKIVRS